MPADVAVRVGDDWYAVAVASPIDLAAPLTESGSEPQFFGADPAAAVPMEAGDFIGNTSEGGSCNVRVWTVNPHCNGTHTESIGHLVDEPVPVGELLSNEPMLARLVSVAADRTGEVPVDAVAGRLDGELHALVIRTMRAAATTPLNAYPVLSAQAMDAVAASRVRHLLIDTPSLDRIDDPILANHRRYWGLAATARSADGAAHAHRTVTEFVRVPANVDDGEYLLCHGCARWHSDAAPSRPTLFALRRLDHAPGAD